MFTLWCYLLSLIFIQDTWIKLVFTAVKPVSKRTTIKKKSGVFDRYFIAYSKEQFLEIPKYITVNQTLKIAPLLAHCNPILKTAFVQYIFTIKLNYR